MLHSEVVGGIVLVVTAAVALAWANSPFAFAYHALWHQPLALRIASYAAEIPLHFLVNEGLMTVFFLVVGLEVRRELHDGALASARLAALPLAAALGGVVVPALLYLALNVSAPARAGWAIGSATDIAFAVGVLALLGRRAPPATRIFLLSIAVIDDIAAVLIIAFFYSDGLDYAGFLVVCAALALVLGMQRAGVSNTWAYMFPGVTLWAGLLWTGAHPTLAGVVLGLMTPVRAPSGANDRPPLARVQAALHPWVAFGVLPLFALVNAGVSLEGVELASDGAMIAGGVLIALVVGKPLGIVLGTWLAVVLGRCTLPRGLARRGVVLAGLFGGIGFTMSIFVATLAFPSAALLDAAKLGVLIASGIAGALGLAVGYASARRTVAREARNTAARERSRI